MSYALFAILSRNGPRSRQRLVRAELHRLALLDRVDRVLVRDVADFVAEHAGELRFVLDQAERAARDVHDAAGRREGVDAVGIEHDEVQSRSGRSDLLRERRADERDVLVDRRILHDAEPRRAPWR